MTIRAALNTPNGLVSFHRIVKLVDELQGHVGSTAVVKAQVHSFATEDAMHAGQVLWQGYPEIPNDALVGANMREDAEQWLAAQTGGDYSGEFCPYAVPGTGDDDLEATRAKVIADNNFRFRQDARALIEGYPEEERLTWPQQRIDAMAWQASENAETPYLDRLAELRGVSREDMLAWALENVLMFDEGSLQLVSRRQRLRDLARDAKTLEELDAARWDAPPAQPDPADAAEPGAEEPADPAQPE